MQCISAILGKYLVFFHILSSLEFIAGKGYIQPVGYWITGFLLPECPGELELLMTVTSWFTDMAGDILFLSCVALEQKDATVRMLCSICQQIWKTQQWPQDWKMLVFIPIPKKGNAKECSNYCTIALISHTSKVMLKILQARFQQYVICELPDVQAGFRKVGGTRDQIANIRWIIDKGREFQ